MSAQRHYLNHTEQILPLRYSHDPDSHMDGLNLCRGDPWFVTLGFFDGTNFTTNILIAIMILRVSVMFNQPKRMQYILFFLYSLVTVNAIIVVFLMAGPHSGMVGACSELTCGFVLTSWRPMESVTSIPIIDITFCNLQYGRSTNIPIYDGIPGALFDVLLMALVIYRFIVHAIETRRMMGRQKINEYMRLLLEHNALYFFLYRRLSPLDRCARRSHLPLGTWLAMGMLLSSSVSTSLQMGCL